MKLVILVGSKKRADDNDLDNPFEIHDNGGWRLGLPQYGADHASLFKEDIVMLVEEDA